MVKKEFKVYSPLTKKSVDKFITKSDGSSDGERILLEGIASTTSRDLHDEIVSSTAIESMSEQALALNIHGDHWYGLEDVIGAIKDASAEDKQLHIKFLITKKHTPDIKDLLETGVKLGLSIGGYVTSYDEKNRIINAIELHEISLTAMPANWDTFGTVTTSKGLVKSNCIAGACHAIVKNLGEEIMATEEIKTKEETSQEEETSGLTKDDVIELFNELMAEKEETIVQEITDKVQTQLESIAEAKVQELLDGGSSSDEEGDDTKATSTEEEEEDEKEEEEETKSITPEDIATMVKDGIAQALGDDFASKVAGEMYGELGKSRSTEGSKFKKFQEQLGDTEPTEPVEKTGYSSEEAAKILLAKQKRANPITAAVMKNLE